MLRATRKNQVWVNPEGFKVWDFAMGRKAQNGPNKSEGWVPSDAGVPVSTGKTPMAERWWLEENLSERQEFMERNRVLIQSKRTNWNGVFGVWIFCSWTGTLIYMARGPPDFRGRHTMMDGFYSHRCLKWAEKIPDEFKIKN